jgi:hypothetical protein
MESAVKRQLGPQLASATKNAMSVTAASSTARKSARKKTAKKEAKPTKPSKMLSPAVVSDMLARLASQYTGGTMPRKESNWISLGAQHVLHAHGHGRESPLEGNIKAAKQMPYYLYISKVVGYRLPNVMVDVPRSDLYFRLQLSFFDKTTRRFFGHTAVDSPFLGPQEGKSPNEPVIKDRPFVYRTSVRNKACIGVLELVVVECKDGITKRQVGVGWANLDLFSNDVTGDIVEQEPAMIGRTASITKFYAGSPRVLCCDGFDLSALGFSNLPEAKTRSGDVVSVWHTLYTYKALQKYFHLFQEHQIITEKTIIPGFPVTPVSMRASGDMKACLQRQLPSVEHARYLDQYAQNIVPISIKFAHPVIELPDQFETMLLWTLLQIKSGYWGKDNANGTIASRRLLVGVHNGSQFVCPPLDIPLRPMYEQKMRPRASDRDAIEAGPPESPFSPASRARMRGELANVKPVADGSNEVTRLDGSLTQDLNGLEVDVLGSNNVVLWFELVYDIDWPNTGRQAISVAWAPRLLWDNSQSLSFHNLSHIILRRGVGNSLLCLGEQQPSRVRYGFSTPFSKALDSPDYHMRLRLDISSPELAALSGAKPPSPTEKQPHTSKAGSPGYSGVFAFPLGAGPNHEDHSIRGSSGLDGGQDDDFNDGDIGTFPLSPNTNKRVSMTPMVSGNSNFNSKRGVGPGQTAGGVGGAGGSRDGRGSLVLKSSSGNSGPQSVRSVPGQLDIPPAGQSGIETAGNQRRGSGSQYGGQFAPPSSAQMTNVAPLSPGFARAGGWARLEGSESLGGAPQTHQMSRDYLMLPTTGVQPVLGSGSSSGPESPAVDLARELSDPAKGAELSFVLQYFCPTIARWAARPLRSLRVAFCFFRDPPFVSAPILLPPLAQIQSFLETRLQRDGDRLNIPVEFSYSFELDPRQHRAFVEYLYTENLFMTLWDADSNLYVGHCLLPLQQFLRQLQNSVEKHIELDCVQEGFAPEPLPAVLEEVNSNIMLKAGQIQTAVGGQNRPESNNPQTTSRALPPLSEVGKIQLTVLHRSKRLPPSTLTTLERLCAHVIPPVASALLALPLGSLVPTKDALPANPANLFLPSQTIMQLRAPLHIAINPSFCSAARVAAHRMVEGDPELAAALQGFEGVLLGPQGFARALAPGRTHHVGPLQAEDDSGNARDLSITDTSRANGLRFKGHSQLPRVSNAGKDGRLAPLRLKDAVAADFVDAELNRFKDDFHTRKQNLAKIREHRARKKESALRQALTTRVTQR